MQRLKQKKRVLTKSSLRVYEAIQASSNLSVDVHILFFIKTLFYYLDCHDHNVISQRRTGKSIALLF